MVQKRGQSPSETEPESEKSSVVAGGLPPFLNHARFWNADALQRLSAQGFMFASFLGLAARYAAKPGGKTLIGREIAVGRAFCRRGSARYTARITRWPTLRAALATA